jgi:acyl-CoA thioester hydrolase
MTPPAPLAGFPVIVAIDLPWGDMDAFAHVNNVAYFRYFEQARVAYLDRVGWMARMREAGVGPIVHSTSARFRKPLSHPDRVHVGARVTDLATDRVAMEHRLVSDRLADVAADGQAVVVCYDYRAGTKAAIPADIRAQIERLERASAHG